MRTPQRLGALVIGSCCLFALVVLVPWAFRAPVKAQDVPSVTFEPGSVTAAAGTSITLKVNIENAGNLAAFQLTLNYDAELLQRGAISAGDFLSQTGRPVTAFEPIELEPGTVMFQVVSGPSDKPGASGAGTLATLSFTGLNEGLSLVSLPEVVLLDTAGNPTIVAGRTATLRLLPPATATPLPPRQLWLPMAFTGKR